MKEAPFLVLVGFVLLLMLISGVIRMNRIRSDAKAARIRQTSSVKIPAPDPSRFSHLRVATLGASGAPMVYIKGGTFWMGTQEEAGEYDEKPVREVRILPYFIDLYEVSNTHYQKFVKRTHRYQQEVMIFFDDVAFLFEPGFPAVGVSWFDALAYCAWDGKRLPTEAEWEYAARGGDQRQFPWGETFLEGYANIRGEEDGFAYTAPVGSFEAGRSAFGLYEMSGNVSEWVFDWYDEFFYKEGQVTLPVGPDTGIAKVHRGGAWDSVATDTRTSKRFATAPGRKEATIGFRCAMDAPREGAG